MPPPGSKSRRCPTSLSLSPPALAASPAATAPPPPGSAPGALPGEDRSTNTKAPPSFDSPRPPFLLPPPPPFRKSCSFPYSRMARSVRSLTPPELPRAPVPTRPPTKPPHRPPVSPPRESPRAKPPEVRLCAQARAAAEPSRWAVARAPKPCDAAKESNSSALPPSLPPGFLSPETPPRLRVKHSAPHPCHKAAPLIAATAKSHDNPRSELFRRWKSAQAAIKAASGVRRAKVASRSTHGGDARDTSQSEANLSSESLSRSKRHSKGREVVRRPMNRPTKRAQTRATQWPSDFMK
mmetsp:Transcript_65533/g.147878  ORF Transcript_65533/g.147878 Transcript_65533/m.147878 type:complete len:295 (-) Transcript_65533:61-945(-)